MNRPLPLRFRRLWAASCEVRLRLSPRSSYSPATNQLWRAILGGFRSQSRPRAAHGRPAAPNASRSCCGAALALGGGLLLLILIVLGVKGCLNARKHRALSDYARNVTQIVEETEQTSKAFFDKLDDPASSR